MAAQAAKQARKPESRGQAQRNRAPEPKILRIGIIHSGRIVEERLIPAGQMVTVGEHPRCTVVISGADLPSKRFELFSYRNNRYYLHFTEKMHGKVSVRDQVVTLVSLAQRSIAKKKGTFYALPLTERNRGKVYVGEYTVLFQFVTPPPQPARVRSADFRAFRWQDVDWLFLGILLFSALLHTAAVIWIESQPPPKRVRLEDFPDRFVRLVLPDEKEPEVAEVSDEGTEEVEATPEEAPEATPEPAPAEADAGGGPEEPQETEEERRERLEEEVSSKGVLALIGTAGESSQGDAIADLLAEGSGLADDVGDALRGSSGVAIARRDTDQAGLRGGGGGDGAAGIGDLAGAGGGAGGTVEKVKAAPKPVLSEGPVEMSVGNASDVRSQMKRYLPRIKACYERELKGNPDLAGKVTVSWLISPEGRAQDTAIESNSTGNATLGSCIVKAIARIKFNPPDDGEDIEVAGYPFLFASE